MGVAPERMHLLVRLYVGTTAEQHCCSPVVRWREWEHGDTSRCWVGPHSIRDIVQLEFAVVLVVEDGRSPVQLDEKIARGK